MYLFLGVGAVAYTILLGKVLKQACCTSKAQRWYQQKYEDLCDVTGQDIPEDYFYNRLVLQHEFLQFKKWLHFYDHHPVFTNIDIIPEYNSDTEAVPQEDDAASEEDCEATTEEEEAETEEDGGATTEEEEAETEEDGVTTTEETGEEEEGGAEENEEEEEVAKGWLDSLRRLVMGSWKQEYVEEDSSSEDEEEREEVKKEEASMVIPLVSEKDIVPLMDKLSE